MRWRGLLEEVPSPWMKFALSAAAEQQPSIDHAPNSALDCNL
jgi:hypothetical protein